jgi:hypothetical protein
MEIDLPYYMSPEDPITLFTMYYPPEIIGYIIKMTNLNQRAPENPESKYARAAD